MKETRRPNPHDEFVKFAFSDTVVAGEFLAPRLPASITGDVDIASLELVQGSFVDEELLERHSDLLYRLSFRDGRKGLVYILFEHKSSPDSLTPLQLLRYMIRIWDRQIRDKESMSPIIPLILYHGEKAWNTSRTLQDIIDAPVNMACYVPHFESHLIDLSQHSNSEFREKLLSNAALRLLKYAGRPECFDQLPEIIRLYQELTEEPRGLACLKAALTYVLRCTDKSDREKLVRVVRRVIEGEEKEVSLMTTIAEAWIQEGLEKGLEQGLEKGLEKGLEQGLEKGLEKGLEQGLEKGREQGIRIGICTCLEIRFPEQAESLIARTSEIHSAQALTELLQLCKTAAAPGDLLRFVDQIKQR